MNHHCHLGMRGDIMSKGYRQAPGKGEKKRTDGKRIAGKQDFGVPGSGGSNPFSNLQDIDMIPASQGGQLEQPRGPHVHDPHICLLYTSPSPRD